MIIDVVYLGEEDSPTELSTISDESWWASKKAQGLVISKIFPVCGTIGYVDVDELSWRGGLGKYWSSSSGGEMNGWFVSVGSEVVASTENEYMGLANAVRLFVRQN